ncbi:putative endopeptidase La [Helianthus annuus]|nr:putative endopeptidase La [Helianthus annuus]
MTQGGTDPNGNDIGEAVRSKALVLGVNKRSKALVFAHGSHKGKVLMLSEMVRVEQDLAFIALSRQIKTTAMELISVLEPVSVTNAIVSLKFYAYYDIWLIQCSFQSTDCFYYVFR